MRVEEDARSGRIGASHAAEEEKECSSPLSFRIETEQALPQIPLRGRRVEKALKHVVVMLNRFGDSLV
jgi:hypothetical protein